MLIPIGLAAALALAQVPPPDAPLRASAELRAARDAIRDRESKALVEVADRLGGEASRSIRARLDPPPDPDGSSRFVPLAEILPPPGPKSALPAEVGPIRAAAAKAFFDLASRGLGADPPHLALADECLREVVARDPGHAGAHRLLGYLPHGGGWATPFAVDKQKRGFVVHPTFGWVEADWVPHLDRGDLPAPRVAGRPTRWLPVAEADELRREFAKGWQISTEHFLVVTNVPLSEAIDFGRRLEALYDLFFSIMADVIGPDLPLHQLARKPGEAPGLPKRTHQVWYFADKEQYIRCLQPVQGEGVRDNLGTYLPAREAKAYGKGGKSFFFRDPGGQLDVTETLYHEVSHQLLFESGVADRYDPARGQFWVLEGLGTYFETLRPQPDGSLRYGGLVGRRIEVAQERLVAKKEFIPIGRLTSMNKFVFNGGGGGDIYLNYVEAMALTVYLMQAHDRRHREGFLDYARDAYRGRVHGNVGRKLDDRLGTSFAELDRDFLAYIRPAAVARPATTGGR